MPISGACWCTITALAIKHHSQHYAMITRLWGNNRGPTQFIRHYASISCISLKCHVGFCTPRCTIMDSKKKKKVQQIHDHIYKGLSSYLGGADFSSLYLAFPITIDLLWFCCGELLGNKSKHSYNLSTLSNMLRHITLSPGKCLSFWPSPLAQMHLHPESHLHLITKCHYIVAAFQCMPLFLATTSGSCSPAQIAPAPCPMAMPMTTTILSLCSADCPFLTVTSCL